MMPELYRSGSLVLFVWSNEGVPTEPIHVHICYKDGRHNSDKFWLSKDGYFVPDKGNSVIKQRVAQNVLTSFIAGGGVSKLEEQWKRSFGSSSIRYFDE